MARALFISDFILAEEQGAKHLTKSHYETLKEIYGDENVDVVAINSIDESWNKHFLYREAQPTKLKKLWNIISGSSFLLSKSGENRIIELCHKNKYDLVFVDHSIYGKLIKRIKVECSIPVVSFFHGIMAFQTEEYQRLNRTSLLYFIPKYNIKTNEMLTVKYCDKCVLLNYRDELNLVKFYGRKADLLLPIYLESNIEIIDEYSTDKFDLLFVGGYFWPNVHGIKWFAENVMPQLPEKVRLTIVGNNMDKLKNEFHDSRINVIGRVYSLQDYYNRADAVVGPIFEGEGMKTKTCEALMYGKIYLGTDEALEGYIGLDDYRCNTKDDFINKITGLIKENCNKYHDDMRNIYLKYYSPIMAKEVLLETFKDLGLIFEE